MLYNPKWGSPPQPKTLEHFLAWCERQPADKSYDWLNPYECACGQYSREIDGNWHRGWNWRDRDFWNKANQLAHGSFGSVSATGCTFSELAQRVRAVLVDEAVPY